MSLNNGSDQNVIKRKQSYSQSPRRLKKHPCIYLNFYDQKIRVYRLHIPFCQCPWLKERPMHGQPRKSLLYGQMQKKRFSKRPVIFRKDSGKRYCHSYNLIQFRQAFLSFVTPQSNSRSVFVFRKTSIKFEKRYCNL